MALSFDTDDCTEHTLPCAEALLAGTLALMTGYAQQADAGTRTLMARKVVSNLFFLSGHPQLSDAFKTLMGNLRTRWQLEVEATSDAATLPTVHSSLWHASPGAVQ